MDVNTQKQNAFVKLLIVVYNNIINYPTPASINYFWSFGSLAAFCLLIQLITGIFLAMHYTPHIDYAFLSIEHIMRNVSNGWFLRYVHANGASIFFLIIFLHIFRGFFYGSFYKPRHFLWITGTFIFILMMASALWVMFYHGGK
jgi:ubiquinol-cytochrome c reductase cytochrome b subunit